MTFSDHKIQSFAKKLTDLPDRPNLSAAELKAYFDSSPEELRQAHNALCTDAERLDNRVSGIVAETFGDTIPKTMLTDELQKEIDAKAEQTALSAEANTRAEADAVLGTRLDHCNTALSQKCEVYFGTYSGNASNDSERFISLGFTPRYVWVLKSDGEMCSVNNTYGGLASVGHPCMRDSATAIQITEGGFCVYEKKISNSSYVHTNYVNRVYHYLAFM